MYALAQTTGGAAAEAAETTAGKFARLKIGFDETKESIGAALLPAIEAVLPYLQKFASWAQDNPQTFMIIAGALAAIAASIVAINIAMALNPIGLIVIGVGLLIAGLAIAYTKFEGFRKIVDGVFGAIKWWITNIVIPQFNLMLTVFKTIFNGIASVWNNTIGKFSFTVPSWVPGIGGKGFAMPDIPMLAAGGIVTGPTLAMIGEAGPEAVIPLDRMSQMGGGGTTVNINVNGGDPQSVVNALRTYMRQNGSVPIRVSNIY
jgi:phage-related protein